MSNIFMRLGEINMCVFCSSGLTGKLEGAVPYDNVNDNYNSNVASSYISNTSY